MKDRFDKELADKIKSELAGFEPTFSHQDWAKMEAKLAAGTTGSTTPILWRYLSVAATLLLLISSISWFTIMQPHFKVDTALDISEDLAPEALAFTTFPQKVGNSQGYQAAVLPSLGAASYNTQTALQVTQSSKTTTILSSPPIDVPTHQKQKNTLSSTEENTNNFTRKEDISSKVLPLSDDIALLDTKENVIHSSIDEELLHKLFPNLFQQLNFDPLQLQSLQEEEYTLQNSKAFDKKPFFSIAFIAVSNYTRDVAYRKTNYGGGLLVGIPMNEKLSINTGIIYTKQSAATFREETILRPTLGGGERETTVGVPTEAAFDWLDIPINVQYQFHHNSKAQLNWYISTGISNYIYIKEGYMYTPEISPLSYKGMASATDEYNKSYGDWHNINFGATLNLSLGVEKIVGKYSLAIEPFIKLPTTRFGKESLPVNAAGMMFKLNTRR